MQSKTNEAALEAAIEKTLTGTCLEELSENLGNAAELFPLVNEQRFFTLNMNQLRRQDTC